MKYNKAGVRALEKVEAMINSFGLPLVIARKFTGIMDAIEIQIEDYEYTEEIVKALDKILLLLAKKCVSEAGYVNLEHALSEFERRLTKKQ